MKILSLLSTIVVAASLMSCSVEDNGSSAKDKTPEVYAAEIPKGRLSKLISPSHYQIDLTIIPAEKSFSGDVIIDLDIKTQTDFIYMHGKLLDVSMAEIFLADGSLMTGKYETVDDTGIVKITFPQKIKLGKTKLHISYKAPFNESLEGLYIVREKDVNYVFSQMEAISARLVFPSFDEPGFKVPFDVSVTTKQELVVIANTPESKVEKLEGGLKKVTFATTKPLPTYLLAFAVGDFDVVEWEDIAATKVRSRPIPLRGIATKGKGKGLKFALENTAKVLNSLEEYFQIPYPYAKLDILALPDFSYGAMENAGAITYREQLLLLNENSSMGAKRRYYGVHAHELAHQWFGNYVTPHWWNDIWLNEAFATWMAQVALDNIMPEQKFREGILRGAMGAMGGDSLVSTRQIRQPILSNGDITSAFDGITYSKGGGVLAMIETFMGPEDFRAGIQNYMKRFAFKNADADDFITAIGEKSTKASMEDIRTAFFSFLEQPGIPYLDVEKSCKGEHTSIIISQSRYFPLGSKGDKNQTWKIPACFGYEIDGVKYKTCSLLQKETETITFPEKGCASYVMPNLDGAGYYRFALDGAGWKALFANQGKLSTKTMMSINDSFGAALSAGTLSIDALMEVAPSMIASKDPSISLAPMRTLGYIYSIAKDMSDEDKAVISKMSRELYSAKMDELYSVKLSAVGDEINEKDERAETKMRKNLLRFMAGTGNDPKIRVNLKRIAYTYVGYGRDGKIHADKVNTNLLSTALNVAVKDSDVKFTRHLMKLFKSSTNGTVRGYLLRAIAGSTDKSVAKDLREKWALTDVIRDNELFSILFNQAYAKKNRPDFWVWFKANLTAVQTRIPEFSQAAIPRAGGGFCDQAGRDDVAKFFKERAKKISGGERTLAQTLESIDLCIARKAHFTPLTEAYIKKIKMKK